MGAVVSGSRESPRDLTADNSLSFFLDANLLRGAFVTECRRHILDLARQSLRIARGFGDCARIIFVLPCDCHGQDVSARCASHALADGEALRLKWREYGEPGDQWLEQPFHDWDHHADLAFWPLLFHDTFRRHPFSPRRMSSLLVRWIRHWRYLRGLEAVRRPADEDTSLAEDVRREPTS
jgi:hypothetical protein